MTRNRPVHATVSSMLAERRAVIPASARPNLPSVTAAIVLLLALACVAPGCDRAGDERTPDGRLVIHYWEKWTGFEGQAVQAVVDDFNASQDRLFVKRLTVSQIDQKLLLATAGGNPPDVAGLWSHSVNVFAEKGALTPLNAMAEEADLSRGDYVPIFWDLCEHRGLLWALPTTPATVALHWNRRLFREAGLDPDMPPRTIDQLDAMAERLTVVEVERSGRIERVRFTELTESERNAKRFKVVQMGFMPSDSWFRSMWCYWFGGELWDGKAKVTPLNDANLRALEWYASYPRKYGLENLQRFAASFGNFDSPQSPFLSEQLAMVIQGVWMHNFISQYAPDLDWSAAAFPAADPSLGTVSIAECDVLVIPRGSRHPREAFEFIRFVNTPASLEKLNLAQRKFSPMKQTSPDFASRHPNPHIGVFIALAASPDIRACPRLPVWYLYQDEINVGYDRVFAGLMTPDQAMADVQARVQQRFDRIQFWWEHVKDQRMREWKEGKLQITSSKFQ